MTSDSGGVTTELRSVQQARAELYTRVLGPMPGQVIGPSYFDTPWPEGAVVEIDGERDRQGRVTITHGLTNPGLLTHPRPGLAGFGFELAICTREAGRWGRDKLIAFTNQVLRTPHPSPLQDVLLYGGMFLSERFLLVPGFQRLPREGQLPNGKFYFLSLICTSIEDRGFLRSRPFRETLPELLRLRGGEWTSDVTEQS